MANIDEVKVMSKEEVEVVASVAAALASALAKDNAQAFKEILDFLEEGAWKLPQGDLALKQEFQKVSGTLTAGGKTVPLQDGKLRGSEISFRAGGVDYKGTVNGKRIDGTSASGAWSATRGG